MRKEKGFTLIELIVIIAIIGILAGMIFVAINPKKQTDNAKESAILAGLAQIPSLIAEHNVSDSSNACNTSTKSGKLFDKVSKQAGDADAICNANKSSYAMSIKFDNNGKETKYCVDARGVHGGVVADQFVGSNEKFDCVSGN